MERTRTVQRCCKWFLLAPLLLSMTPKAGAAAGTQRQGADGRTYRPNGSRDRSAGLDPAAGCIVRAGKRAFWMSPAAWHRAWKGEIAVEPGRAWIPGGPGGIGEKASFCRGEVPKLGAGCQSYEGVKAFRACREERGVPLVPMGDFNVTVSPTGARVAGRGKGSRSVVSGGAVDWHKATQQVSRYSFPTSAADEPFQTGPPMIELSKYGTMGIMTLSADAVRSAVRQQMVNRAQHARVLHDAAREEGRRAPRPDPLTHFFRTLFLKKPDEVLAMVGDVLARPERRLDRDTTVRFTSTLPGEQQAMHVSVDPTVCQAPDPKSGQLVRVDGEIRNFYYDLPHETPRFLLSYVDPHQPNRIPVEAAGITLLSGMVMQRDLFRGYLSEEMRQRAGDDLLQNARRLYALWGGQPGFGQLFRTKTLKDVRKACVAAAAKLARDPNALSDRALSDLFGEFARNALADRTLGDLRAGLSYYIGLITLSAAQAVEAERGVLRLDE